MVVRVYDDLVQIRDLQTGNAKGNLRVLVYLEDQGLAKKQSLQERRDQAKSKPVMPPTAEPTQAASGDYDAVWQLEMWKRAEEAKFKAYLKQREIEKI